MINIHLNISFSDILLFLSSYSPLLLIFAIKIFSYNYFYIPLINISIDGYVFSIIFILIFLFLACYSYKLLKSGSSSTRCVYVEKVDEKSDIILSYLIPYVFSVISLNSQEELLSMIVVFLFIFFIYVKYEIIFINPLFILFGFKFYHLHTKKNYVIVLSKNNLFRYIDKEITVSQLSTRLFIFEGDTIE